MRQTPSANIQHLREHGPTPFPEMPSGRVSISDRRNGVWKFKLHGNSDGGGGSDSTGGQVTGVAYLRAEHSRREVVRAFLDANPRFVAAKTRRGARTMMNKHGDDWREAIADVTADYDWKPRADE